MGVKSGLTIDQGTAPPDHTRPALWAALWALERGETTMTRWPKAANAIGRPSIASPSPVNSTDIWDKVEFFSLHKVNEQVRDLII